MASTSGRSLSKECVDTCLSLLKRLQEQNSTTNREKAAAKQLAAWLASIDLSDSSDTDEALDEPSRALLASYTDRGNGWSRKRYNRSLGDTAGSSPGMRNSIFKMQRTGEPESLARELDKLDDWCKFDVFKVALLTDGAPLQRVTLALLDRFDLVDKLHLDRSKLQSFLREVEKEYSKDNPYHNSIHAADVTQSLACLLSHDTFSGSLNDLELLSMIIAAAVHDVGHPGVSNEFLVQSAAVVALEYNDNSVNENMHAAKAFSIFVKPQNNFMAHLPEGQYRYFRRTVISIVLSTDMAGHAELVSDFTSYIRLLGPNLESWHPEKKLRAMQMVVHSADIANPAKPLQFSQQWVDRVLREFFAQGDLEKERGLPVSPQCDREKVEVARSQLAFLERVVKPCYQHLQMLAPNSAAVALQVIEEAHQHWEDLLSPPGVAEKLPPILESCKRPASAGPPKVSSGVFELDDV